MPPDPPRTLVPAACAKNALGILFNPPNRKHATRSLLLLTMKRVGALVSRSFNSLFANADVCPAVTDYVCVRRLTHYILLKWECSLSHFYVVTLTTRLSWMFQLLIVVFSVSVVSELRTVMYLFPILFRAQYIFKHLRRVQRTKLP